MRGAVTAEIRPATVRDIEALGVLAGAIGHRGWGPDALVRELERDSSIVLVAARATGLVGVVVVMTVLDEADLLFVGVRPDCRGARVGAALLSAAHQRAADLGVRVVHLEVAARNDPALRLYERAGYVRVGRRAGYYPDDDALVLAARLAD